MIVARSAMKRRSFPGIGTWRRRSPPGKKKDDQCDEYKGNNGAGLAMNVRSPILRIRRHSTEVEARLRQIQDFHEYLGIALE